MFSEGLIFKPHNYVPGLFGKVELMVILTFQIPFCAQLSCGNFLVRIFTAKIEINTFHGHWAKQGYDWGRGRVDLFEYIKSNLNDKHNGSQQ